MAPLFFAEASNPDGTVFTDDPLGSGSLVGGVVPDAIAPEAPRFILAGGNAILPIDIRGGVSILPTGSLLGANGGTIFASNAALGPVALSAALSLAGANATVGGPLTGTIASVGANLGATPGVEIALLPGVLPLQTGVGLTPGGGLDVGANVAGINVAVAAPPVVTPVIATVSTVTAPVVNVADSILPAVALTGANTIDLLRGGTSALVRSCLLGGCR